MNNRIILVLLLLSILVGGIYLIYTPEKLKIYDLTVLEKEPAHLPPTTATEAVYTAFSLEEVKTKMTKRHQTLKKHTSAYSQELYWTVTAEKRALPETQNNQQWRVMFQTNIIPSYICDISFTNTGITQGRADVVCGHGEIK